MSLGTSSRWGTGRSSWSPLYLVKQNWKSNENLVRIAAEHRKSTTWCFFTVFDFFFAFSKKKFIDFKKKTFLSGNKSWNCVSLLRMFPYHYRRRWFTARSCDINKTAIFSSRKFRNIKMLEKFVKSWKLTVDAITLTWHASFYTSRWLLKSSTTCLLIARRLNE